MTVTVTVTVNRPKPLLAVQVGGRVMGVRVAAATQMLVVFEGCLRGRNSDALGHASRLR